MLLKDLVLSSGAGRQQGFVSVEQELILRHGYMSFRILGANDGENRFRRRSERSAVIIIRPNIAAQRQGTVNVIVDHKIPVTEHVDDSLSQAVEAT